MTIADQILYEDNHLIAVNKLSGQIVQADKTGDICMSDLIKAYIKERDSKPGNVFCGVIHRLDRPVSGVVLFAKTSKALSRMNQMIKERDFQKIYRAIVTGNLPAMQGHLEDYLVRNAKLNKSFVTADSTNPEAKLASLDYRLLGTSNGGYNLVEIELHTGRHHQIRCQLAHMGCPVKGDLKYGAPRSNPDGSISLHAYNVTFIHPVRQQPVHITAPQPWQNMF